MRWERLKLFLKKIDKKRKPPIRQRYRLVEWSSFRKGGLKDALDFFIYSLKSDDVNKEHESSREHNIQRIIKKFGEKGRRKTQSIVQRYKNGDFPMTDEERKDMILSYTIICHTEEGPCFIEYSTDIENAIVDCNCYKKKNIEKNERTRCEDVHEHENIKE